MARFIYLLALTFAACACHTQAAPLDLRALAPSAAARADDIVEEIVEEIVQPERQEQLSEDVDSILDEIDAVLEENAEDFVRGFVQKGGQ